MDANRAIVAQPAAAPAARARDARARPAGRASFACRRCGAPLSALQRLRGDVCDAMDCRRRAIDDLRRAERTAALADAVQKAADDGSEPGLRNAPVIWLSDHDTRLVDATDAERAAQREYLRSLEAAADSDPDSDDARGNRGDRTDAATPTIAHRLCAFCAGRCCRSGADHHAWLGADDLRRWLRHHVGRTWADAVDAYLRRIPDRHVAGSCLHHGEHGCTLPRELRSRTCNAYACDALAELRRLAAAEPGVRVVAAVVKSHRLHGAAMVSADGTRALR